MRASAALATSMTRLVSSSRNAIRITGANGCYSMRCRNGAAAFAAAFIACLPGRRAHGTFVRGGTAASSGLSTLGSGLDRSCRILALPSSGGVAAAGSFAGQGRKGSRRRGTGLGGAVFRGRERRCGVPFLV